MSRGPADAPSNVRVLHRGALGDSALLWPRLRHWARSGARVELVTDRAKAALAAREMGIIAIDAEQPRYNNLWREAAAVDPIPGDGTVFDHLSSPASTVFRANLRVMFPDARIIHESPPRGGREGAEWVAGHPLARCEHRSNVDGPIVLHVGAGSPAKRWPLEQWQALAIALASCAPVLIIAGEVERERFADEQHRLFQATGGVFLDGLADLAGRLRVARLVVAADSGPGHLAAQLGIATLSLFGPSDPGLWAPVGPCVCVLAPPSPREMDWLEAERVAAAAIGMLA